MRAKEAIKMILLFMREQDKSPEGSNDLALIKRIELTVDTLSPAVDVELGVAPHIADENGHVINE